jgi:predicted outer membrane repeat protein
MIMMMMLLLLPEGFGGGGGGERGIIFGVTAEMMTGVVVVRETEAQDVAITTFTTTATLTRTKHHEDTTVTTITPLGDNGSRQNNRKMINFTWPNPGHVRPPKVMMEHHPFYHHHPNIMTKHNSSSSSRMRRMTTQQQRRRRLVGEGERRGLLSCVRNQTELEKAINDAIDYNVTRIDVCLASSPQNIMKMDARSFGKANYTGINIVRKNLEIYCHLDLEATSVGTAPFLLSPSSSSSSRCILDAQYLSRHFYIYDSTVFIFQNGFSKMNSPNQTDGGAFLFEFSNITYQACSFLNNRGDDGGAIASYYSDITFVQDKDDNDEEEAANSTIILFLNNTAMGTYGGAIYCCAAIYCYDNPISSPSLIRTISFDTNYSSSRSNPTMIFRQNTAGNVSTIGME